jgi:hypothetical protein
MRRFGWWLFSVCVGGFFTHLALVASAAHR